jgi:nitroreductase
MTERPAAAALAEAAAAAGYAPSVHNTQPWRWRVHDDTLELYADRSRALPVADPDGRLLTISCGTAVHHCLVALTAQGRATAVDRLPEPSDPDLLTRMRLSGTIEVTPDVVHMFQNLRLRHTDRRPVSSAAAPREAVDAVRRAGTGSGIDIQLLTADQVDALGSACAQADAIESADPSQRLELAYWVGGDRAAGTGLGLDVIPADAPSGPVPGRDFLRTGTLAAPPAQAGGEGAATYLMLFGSGDEPADWLRAGEALSAAWLTATELGLSVLPFSSVIEVATVRESLRQSVLAGLGEPYLVVRLGVPDPEHGLAARTPRLPAEQTISVG